MEGLRTIGGEDALSAACKYFRCPRCLSVCPNVPMTPRNAAAWSGQPLSELKSTLQELVRGAGTTSRSRTNGDAGDMLDGAAAPHAEKAQPTVEFT